MFTRLPLCKPVPEKLAGRFRVCWLSTGRLDKTCAGLASQVEWGESEKARFKARYCISRKNKFPGGGVRVVLSFVPSAVEMV